MRLVLVFVPAAVFACGGASDSDDLFATPPGGEGGAVSGRGGARMSGSSSGAGAGGSAAGRGGGASGGVANVGGGDEAGAAGDAGTPSGGRGGRGGGGPGGGGPGGGGPGGGGLGGGGLGGGSGGASGGAGEAGSGNVDCNELIADAQEKLVGAQECRLDVSRLTCVGVVTDPCGCTHPVDLQKSVATQAYEAAVKALASECVLFCPERECPKVTAAHCGSVGAGVIGQCVAASVTD